MEKSFTIQMSPEQKERMLEALKTQHGAKVNITPGSNIEVSTHGVTFTAYYNEKDSVLNVNVFTHPFYLPVGVIRTALTEIAGASDPVER